MLFAGAGNNDEILVFDLEDNLYKEIIKTELIWVKRIEKISAKHLGYVSSDNMIYSSHIESKEESQTYVGHIDQITKIVRLPNEYFCSSSKDKTLKLWNVGRKSCLLSFEEHKHGVLDCAFIHSRNWMSSYGEFESVVKIWDLQKMKGLTDVPVNDTPTCLRIDPREFTIMVASREKKGVQLFDLRTKIKKKRWNKPARIRNPQGYINTMTYFYDHSLLVTGDSSGKISYFDTRMSINRKKLTSSPAPSPRRKKKSLQKKKWRRYSESSNPINEIMRIDENFFCVCNEGGVQVYTRNGELERMISTDEEIYTCCQVNESSYDDILGLRIIDDDDDDDDSISSEGEKLTSLKYEKEDGDHRKKVMSLGERILEKLEDKETYDFSKMSNIKKFFLCSSIWLVMWALIFVRFK